ELRNVTIRFRSYQKRPTTLKESLLRLTKRDKEPSYSYFEALKNISLSIPRGEVFGIIGGNGAGKSTMLRTIAGVLPPSSGEMIVNGKIDSLIQLGAGFDAELNAIENIYLNRSLHGMSRAEIKERVPDIIAFAELEEFASTPIKYYSSGMAARLGFAVAIDRDPDILVVDEVLAVGDERFNNKCMKVFEELLAKRRTIVMVSHNLEQIQQWAKTAALLAKGKIFYLGDPEEAVARYRDPGYQEYCKAN
ncbi:UNVERIFIED_CONTAM: hypothetical protein GTU68_067054, partial [Idotea baltica]|nr:hypothetical protein [Idotea baltica]